jgi:hypothetical protein
MQPAPDVELVHLDDCPLWRGAATRLREAVRVVGLDPAAVRYRSVATAAAPADFPGSPTILIGGRDPFAEDVVGGPACRRYPTERGLDVAPSLAQLVRVLTR